MMDDLFANLDLEKSKQTVQTLETLNKKRTESFQTIITTTDILNLEKSGFVTKNINHQKYYLKN